MVYGSSVAKARTGAVALMSVVIPKRNTGRSGDRYLQPNRALPKAIYEMVYGSSVTKPRTGAVAITNVVI